MASNNFGHPQHAFCKEAPRGYLEWPCSSLADGWSFVAAYIQLYLIQGCSCFCTGFGTGWMKNHFCAYVRCDHQVSASDTGHKGLGRVPQINLQDATRHWRIMLEKVTDSARKAVKLADPYKPYGGQFLEFCFISLSTYQTQMKLTRNGTDFCLFFCRHYPHMPRCHITKSHSPLPKRTELTLRPKNGLFTIHAQHDLQGF